MGIKSIDQFKLIPLTGLDLSLTFSGTGAGTAKLYPNGTIVVIATTTFQASKICTITTPVALTITAVRSIHKDGTSAKWTIKNGSNALSDEVTMAASDTDLDFASKIIDSEADFVEDDDDLIISLDATGAALAKWIFDVNFLQSLNGQIIYRAG